MSAFQKKMRLMWSCILPVLARQGVALWRSLVVAAMVALTHDAFAGANTNLPFTDVFEGYTNLTPLNTGTNGWYGSSSNIIVLSNTAFAAAGSTNSAMIPVDCALSNRFTGIASSNVWIQMDVRPSFYDSTNPPVVTTNVAGMFYINSNGNFVVHNGPATNPSPTNSLSWMTLTNCAINTNGTTWVRIGIYENFSTKSWDLYTNSTLVTNNIGFINTNLTNFAGFNLYSGAQTSYLDNVYVTNANAGPAAKVNVETAVDGSGTIVPLQNLTAGSTLTVYAITRDASSNFVANVAAASWALIAKTGGVIDGDLVPSGDMKSAVLSGAMTGTATIVATSGALTTNTSGVITVIAGAAAKAVFSTQPSASTVAGVAFATQPVVTIWDAFSNTVTTATSNVVLTLTTGTGVLGGTANMSAVAGVADFAGKGLNIDKVGADKVLTATVSGLTVGTTAPAFAITPAAAAKVRVETAADGSGTIVPLQDLISGSNLTAYAITRDASDNFVTNVVADSWALINITGGVVASDLVASVGMKSATLTGLASGSAQIQATSGILTTQVSGVITVIGTGGNATVIPTTADHTLGATAALVITLTPNGWMLTQITSSGTGSPLVENTDYTVAGNVYTILATYLNAQSVGTVTLTFNMNGGANPATVVTVSAASPTGLTASKGLRREVKITWSVSPGATSYELWKNTVNESSSAKLLASGSATLYRDMQVIPGLHYYYWVKALSASGDSGFGTSSEGWCGAAKWDFNGDGLAEAWYYNEDGGRWYVMMTTNMLSTAELGGAGWAVAPGDYDGDGKTDLAVYEAASGTWQALMSGSGYALAAASGFGGAGYTVAVGDYDGDGKADPAIYAQASGTWQIAMSGNGYRVEVVPGFGSSGYQAVSADYDGDGKTDPAIYEEVSGNWLMALSGNDYQISYVTQFGESGFAPVPGEYEGRGYAQIAVYHEASGNWYIRTGPGPGEYTTVYFGQPGYLPMPADYDGDKYEDEGVFYRNRHDAIWYLLRSTDGFKMISGRSSRP